MIQGMKVTFFEGHVVFLLAITGEPELLGQEIISVPKLGLGITG